ncbi:MAG: AI-2E family transporter [Coriobacteriaceae bacterium]|nr:AI-2E family transporter [Coriobacteriaceae bacterium]
MKVSAERIRLRFFLIWSIIGVLLLLVALGYVLGQVWTAISIVLFSAFLVFIMRSPVSALEKRGVPRILGTALSFLGAFVIVAAIVLIFAPIIWGQMVGLLSLIPQYAEQSQDFWNDIYHQYSYLLEDDAIKQLIAQAATEVSRWAANTASVSAGSVITVGANLVVGVVVMTVSLVVCFWVLKDLPRIGKELLILIGPRYASDALFIATTCARSLGGYIKGMVIACICTGTISGIGFAIIGLPYPAVLGLFTGLMNFIPFVGPWVSGIIVGCIGLFSGPIVALLAVLCLVIAQQTTDNFISPRVMSYAVELHPAVVLVVLIAGGAIGGALGILAAIPLTSALKTIFVHYFQKRTGRQLLSADGAIFRGTAVDREQVEEPSDAEVDK